MKYRVLRLVSLAVILPALLALAVVACSSAGATTPGATSTAISGQVLGGASPTGTAPATEGAEEATEAASPPVTPGVTPVTVSVTAKEFSFELSQDTFKVGTRYHFVVQNAGTVNHDFWVVPEGVTDESQKVFGIDGDDLPAGTAGTVDWTFDKAGKYDIACFVPGHYEAGMHTTITVQ